MKLNRTQTLLIKLIDNATKDWENWYPKHTSCETVAATNDVWSWIEYWDGDKTMKGDDCWLVTARNYHFNLTHALHDILEGVEGIHETYADPKLYSKKEMVSLAIDALYASPDLIYLFPDGTANYIDDVEYKKWNDNNLKKKP